MDGQTSYQDMHEARAMAYAALEQFVPTTEARARAEAEYWSLLYERETAAKAAGVPATLARDAARADRRVAQAYVRFQCAQAIEEATRQEHLMRKKDVEVAKTNHELMARGQ